jgi:hypothetical protein
VSEYRDHTISSQFRPKALDYVAKVRAPDGTEYGPFLGASQEEAEEKARAKVRELCPWRDLDKEPLTPEEEAAQAMPYSVPARPKRRGLSRFLSDLYLYPSQEKSP